MISRALPSIYQRVSGELATIFKNGATNYRHRTETTINHLRYWPGTVDDPTQVMIWARDLPAADRIVPFPVPTDRAFQLLERMRTARRESESAVYWNTLDRTSELSPRELETLRHLTAINRRLDDIATARGVDPTRLRADVTAHLRRLLAGRPVATRVGPEVLEAVLRDGRFKTKFETGKSAGGAKVEGRVWQEHTWFGYDRKILPDDRRPVYGYVMVNGEYAAATGPHGLGWFERLADSEWKQGIGDSDLLSAYGEVQVVFKRWLDNRLANHIRRTGAGPGDPVVDAAYERRAVFDRDIEMLKRPRSSPADPVEPKW